MKTVRRRQCNGNMMERRAVGSRKREKGQRSEGNGGGGGGQARWQTGLLHLAFALNVGIKLTSGGESACVGGNHPNVSHILSIFLGVIVGTPPSLYTSETNNTYSMFFMPASVCIFLP